MFRAHVLIIGWSKYKISIKYDFEIFLTEHLSIFISAFNELDGQNLFYNKFYFTPLHVSSACAYHQEVKTALNSLWYHQGGRLVHETAIYRYDDTG